MSDNTLRKTSIDVTLDALDAAKIAGFVGVCGIVGVIGSYVGPQIVPSLIEDEKTKKLPYTLEELGPKAVVFLGYAGAMTYHVNTILENPTNPWAYFPVLTNAIVLSPVGKLLRGKKEEQLELNIGIVE